MYKLFKKLQYAFFYKRNARTIKQLSFSELRIKEHGSLKTKLKPWFAFVAFLPLYLNKKQTKFIYRFLNLTNSVFKVIFKLKGFVTIKLIWGRGKLGKPLLHIGTLILAGVVFLTGGVFQKNLIVLSKGEQEIFVSSGSDIVPQPVLVSLGSPAGAQRDTVTKYTVQSGDTLSSIGKRFNVTVDTIRYANTISDIGYLKVGQEIDIPPVNGVVYKVVSGDTIASIAKKYKVSEQAIADFNYLSKPFILTSGQELVLPNANIPAPVVATPVQVVPGSTVNPTYTGAAYTFIPYADHGNAGNGNFIWPTNNRYITQYFSWYHPAIDIAVQSPIYAADSGIVIRSGWWTNGYGFAVQIDHRNGYVTTYAHMSVLKASVGDEVNQGDLIGIMGSTGRSTGPHVHFSIQYQGSYVDPLKFY